MRFPLHVLVLSWLDLSRGKVWIGLAQKEEIYEVGRFCFTIPSPLKGRIYSDTLINSKGDRSYLVLNKVSSILEPLKEDESRCQHLSKSAIVRENLDSIGPEGALAVYHLEVALHEDWTKVPLVLHLLKCGSTVDSMYRIQFQNPGTMFVREFSCEEMGALPTAFFVMLLSGGMAILFFEIHVYLHQSRKENAVTTMTLLSGTLFVVSAIFFFVHVLIYSNDGQGLILIKLLSHIVEFFGTVLFTVATAYLAWDLGSSADDAITAMSPSFVWLIAIYVVSYLLLCVRNGLSEQVLFPLGNMRTGSLIFIHLLMRTIMAAYIFRGCIMVVGSAGTSPEKRIFLYRCAFIGALWQLALPLLASTWKEPANIDFLLVTIFNCAAVYGIAHHFKSDIYLGSVVPSLAKQDAAFGLPIGSPTPLYSQVPASVLPALPSQPIAPNNIASHVAAEMNVIGRQPYADL